MRVSNYSWHIVGLLILIGVFLFARDVGRETLATNPSTDCFWHKIDRRQNNDNADKYLYLYHWLRL